jgi:phage replication-related protein YjqB (UPF0714/DUF867 family)
MCSSVNRQTCEDRNFPREVNEFPHKDNVIDVDMMERVLDIVFVLERHNGEVEHSQCEVTRYFLQDFSLNIAVSLLKVEQHFDFFEV